MVGGSQRTLTATSRTPADAYIGTKKSSLLLQRKIVDHDFDLTIHAIGDAAVETFLDGCISVKDVIREKELRPSVIHSQIMNERIFEKYKIVDAIGLVQPMYHSFRLEHRRFPGRRAHEDQLLFWNHAEAGHPAGSRL